MTPSVSTAPIAPTRRSPVTPPPTCGPPPPVALPPVVARSAVDGLPRSTTLTDALLGGGVSAAMPDASAGTAGAVRERLEQGLARVVGTVDVGTPVVASAAAVLRLLRIGHYQVARGLEGRGGPRGAPPSRGAPAFRWTARAARRSIGLAALRAGLDGRAATPAEAVGLVVGDPGGPHGVGRSGPGSCADWLTSLAAPARSLVAAEATTWATRLWTALDWSRLGDHLLVGGPDRWWRWSDGSLRVAVRGRVDVRVGAAGGRGGAALVVLDGQPGPATRHGLLLRPLVETLSTRSRRPASTLERVVGWWPDCGKAWVVPVDEGALGAAADAVVAATGPLLGTVVPGGQDANR
jgi:hypothetical protein